MSAADSDSDIIEEIPHEHKGWGSQTSHPDATTTTTTTTTTTATNGNSTAEKSFNASKRSSDDDNNTHTVTTTVSGVGPPLLRDTSPFAHGHPGDPDDSDIDETPLVDMTASNSALGVAMNMMFSQAGGSTVIPHSFTGGDEQVVVTSSPIAPVESRRRKAGGGRPGQGGRGGKVQQGSSRGIMDELVRKRKYFINKLLAGDFVHDNTSGTFKKRRCPSKKLPKDVVAVASQRLPQGPPSSRHVVTLRSLIKLRLVSCRAENLYEDKEEFDGTMTLRELFSNQKLNYLGLQQQRTVPNSTKKNPVIGVVRELTTVSLSTLTLNDLVHAYDLQRSDRFVAVYATAGYLTVTVLSVEGVAPLETAASQSGMAGGDNSLGSEVLSDGHASDGVKHELLPPIPEPVRPTEALGIVDEATPHTAGPRV